ncbi:hypothetical protein Tco_0818160 [Tanacetum coccineum]
MKSRNRQREKESDGCDYDHGSFEAFLSYEAKHRLEINFHFEKRHGFLRGVDRKELGKESANESETRLEMERHPEDHACQSAAMLHELLNDMENLRME